MDQVPETFNRYLFLKRTLQFVFSISVLSFFLCCSSGFSLHPQSFNAYFSTCLFSMFTHTLERKYVFLICNGILAFLAKNSFMASSPPDFQAFNMSETKSPPVCDTVVVPLLVGEEQVLDQVKVQQEQYEEASETEEEQGDSTYTQNKEIVGNDEKEEGKEGGTESEPMATQDDDDDEVEETTMATNELELANTDELNRKFEEFIRKMKEEIRIEAQRQLIAV